MDQHESEVPALIDPICGVPVNASSPHSSVRGGAMFFFCSEVCKARFVADPSRVVVITATDVSEPVPVQAVADAPDEEAAGSLEVPDLQQDADESVCMFGLEDEHPQPGWFQRLVKSWSRTRRERQHVVRTSSELLSLYRTITAVHPDLSDREHFKLLVMARNGCDSTVANLVLERAEESFAQWPVTRELTLCDVVHYLSVSEYFAAHAGEPWMSSDANINLIVQSNIPHRLCVDRKKE